jgi:hypothetical protein
MVGVKVGRPALATPGSRIKPKGTIPMGSEAEAYPNGGVAQKVASADPNKVAPADPNAAFWDRLAMAAKRAEYQRGAEDRWFKTLRQLAADLGEPLSNILPWCGENGKDVLLRYAFVNEPPQRGETIWSRRRGVEDYCHRIARLVRGNADLKLRPGYVHQVWKDHNKVRAKGTKKRC